MPVNRQVYSNAVSNQSTPAIEDAFRQLEISDTQQHGDVVQSNPYPDRPGERTCLYYLRTGMCGYGSNCRFNHPSYGAEVSQVTKDILPERIGQPDCEYFLKTGTCKYGSTCKYHHPSDRNGAGPVLFNSVGLPLRQDEESCSFYMRTGSCKFGISCKFNHPQPSSSAKGFPVSGPPAFVSTGSSSSSVPSEGLTYMGGAPTWSLHGPQVNSGPRSQVPQTYVPFVFSSSQSITPAQGWNTYMGNPSPASSNGVLASNFVYNSRNQGDLSSGEQLQMITTPNHNFPERPDRPECRYFMNTGTCKYGSDCKYHHPNQRITQQMFDNGLPSRPGQAVCSNYRIYGICKFGPSCRYDHPFIGYPYNLTTWPVPTLLDPSFQNYPVIPTTTLSETSPSLKLPERIQSSSAAMNKLNNSDTKISNDPSEEPASSSEVLVD